MKRTPNRSAPCPSNTLAGKSEGTSDTEGQPTQDFLALFRSRWNCAILRALRPQLSHLPPPKLRRFELNRHLCGALEKSVSNALDTLEDAGLIERILPPSTRGTLYLLTPDGLRVASMLCEVDEACGKCRALLRRAHNRGQSARKCRTRRQNRAKR